MTGIVTHIQSLPESLTPAGGKAKSENMRTPSCGGVLYFSETFWLARRWINTTQEYTMITTLLLAGVLVGAPGKKAHKVDTADVLYRMERYIDTSCNEGERRMEMMHLNEKGMGRVHRDVRPTFYKSPFNKRKEIG